METSTSDTAEQAIPKAELPPLPFTYERTFDPKQAAYQEWRISRISFAGKKNEPKTDDQIVEAVKRQREGTDWFLSEYWRKKGLPQEQLEFLVGEQPITIYNYSQEKPFTDEHVVRMQKALGELASRFPQVVDKIRWILIDDIAHASGFGDPENYPLNGDAMSQWHAFRYLPRGMELIPHRVQATSNFEGTFIHEMTHLIDRDFEDEWGEKFKWNYCIDSPDEWETRPTPDGKDKKFFNKQTGEMSPQGQFSLQPDQSVTHYARQNMGEDICDSMVAYVYDPDLLKTVSLDKYDILARHDAKKPHPEVTIKRVPKEEIKLPEIKPETIHYYIEEPEAAIP